MKTKTVREHYSFSGNGKQSVVVIRNAAGSPYKVEIIDDAGESVELTPGALVEILEVLNAVVEPLTPKKVS